MNRFSAMALVLCMLISARSSFTQPVKLDRNDFVELQRTECLGSCPVYTVRIFADGRVVWKGKSAVKVRGDATSHVALAEASKLIEKFIASGFWDLPDPHGRSSVDGPSSITTLHVGKRERRYPGISPIWVELLGLKVDSLANTKQWTGR